MSHHHRVSPRARALARRPRASRPTCESLEGRALLTLGSAYDPTFGTSGFVIGPADNDAGTALSYGTAVAVQADGKVVEVGTYGSP